MIQKKNWRRVRGKLDFFFFVFLLLANINWVCELVWEAELLFIYLILFKLFSHNSLSSEKLWSYHLLSCIILFILIYSNWWQEIPSQQNSLKFLSVNTEIKEWFPLFQSLFPKFSSCSHILFNEHGFRAISIQ